jgi:hypothetical protein
MIYKIMGIEIVVDYSLELLDKKLIQFIDSHLRKFDVSLLSEITITRTNQNNDWWRGHIWYANKNKNKNRKAKILIATNNHWSYPLTKDVHTGTEKINDDGDWKYTHTTFTFNTQEEAMIKVYGHEIFHFLKKTKQLSTAEFGRNGNPSANRYALELVKQYQNFKG